jgi:hypothetical protein
MQKKLDRNTIYLIFTDFFYKYKSASFNLDKDSDSYIKFNNTDFILNLFKKYFNKYFPYIKSKEQKNGCFSFAILPETLDISKKTFTFPFFLDLFDETLIGCNEEKNFKLQFFLIKIKSIIDDSFPKKVYDKTNGPLFYFNLIKQYFIKYSINNTPLQDILNIEKEFILDVSNIINYSFDEIKIPINNYCIKDNPLEYPILKYVSLKKFTKKESDNIKEEVLPNRGVHEVKTIHIENDKAKLMKTFLKNFTNS